ncbi:hypothetical protein BDD12DRAFT_828287 [Trichophaea hybrida]|nr:hypothetical protein BDD12DRAFT_828287 [Trichophaea hybrida]
MQKPPTAFIASFSRFPLQSPVFEISLFARRFAGPQGTFRLLVTASLKAYATMQSSHVFITAVNKRSNGGSGNGGLTTGEQAGLIVSVIGVFLMAVMMLWKCWKSKRVCSYHYGKHQADVRRTVQPPGLCLLQRLRTTIITTLRQLQPLLRTKFHHNKLHLHPVRPNPSCHSYQCSHMISRAQSLLDMAFYYNRLHPRPRRCYRHRLRQCSSPLPTGRAVEHPSSLMPRNFQHLCSRPPEIMKFWAPVYEDWGV